MPVSPFCLVSDKGSQPTISNDKSSQESEISSLSSLCLSKKPSDELVLNNT